MVPCDENFGVAILGFVQHEIGDFGAVTIVAHLVEEIDTEAGALNGFQKHLGNNHVGVDIDQRHGRRDALKFFELVHCKPPDVDPLFGASPALREV